MDLKKNRKIKKHIKLIILAGRKGTRLSEETFLKPKPMIEIGHFPIIWHIMKSFSYYGVEEYIRALSYKSEVFKNYFINYKQFSENISLDLKNTKHKS